MNWSNQLIPKKKFDFGVFYDDFLDYILQKVQDNKFDNHSIQLYVKFYNDIIKNLEWFDKNICFGIHIPDNSHNFEYFDCDLFKIQSKYFLSKTNLHYNVFEIIKKIFTIEKFEIVDADILSKLNSTLYFDQKYNRLYNIIYISSLNIMLLKVYEFYNEIYNEFSQKKQKLQLLVDMLYCNCKQELIYNVNIEDNFFNSESYKNNLIQIRIYCDRIQYDTYRQCYDIIKVHYDDLLQQKSKIKQIVDEIEIIIEKNFTINENEKTKKDCCLLRSQLIEITDKNNISIRKLTDTLKKKYNIIYDKNKNYKGKKGCYIGISLKHIFDEDNNKESIEIIDIPQQKSISENQNHDKNKNTRQKKKTIPKALRMKVWNKYVGIQIGQCKCLCCKLIDISQMNFHCGHVISEKCGGNIDLENLRPICSSCNSSMGVMNMNEFIENYQLHHEEKEQNTYSVIFD